MNQTKSVFGKLMYRPDGSTSRASSPVPCRFCRGAVYGAGCRIGSKALYRKHPGNDPRQGGRSWTSPCAPFGEQGDRTPSCLQNALTGKTCKSTSNDRTPHQAAVPHTSAKCRAIHEHCRPGRKPWRNIVQRDHERQAIDDHGEPRRVDMWRANLAQSICRSSRRTARVQFSAKQPAMPGAPTCATAEVAADTGATIDVMVILHQHRAYPVWRHGTNACGR